MDEVKDSEHAQMVVKWIEKLESRLPEGKELIYKSEAPCSGYYIDLVVKGTHSDYLYEFKTEIEDIGEILRQLRKYEDKWPNEGKRKEDFEKEFHYSSDYHLAVVLIALDTERNRKHLKKYGKLFKDFRIGLYNIEKNEISALSGEKKDLFPMFKERSIEEREPLL